VEYLTALLNNLSNPAKKKFGSSQFLIVEYVNYIRSKGINMLSPCVNRSGEKFKIDSKRNIRFSLGHIKNVANSASTVAEYAPYESLEDFYNRAKKNNRRCNKKVVESLIAAGAFNDIPIGADEDGNGVLPRDRNDILAAYYKLRKEKNPPDSKTEKEWDAFEKDVVRMRLSKVPIREEYKELIAEKRWCVIDKALVRNSAMVFARIEDIVPKTSKKGNPMYIVELCDDINSMSIFVFKNAMREFSNQFKKGYIVALPIKSFEDSESDMRFYDNFKSGRVEIIEK
jgi:DNA polymerase-3 subunit alpha